jgi:hypothetical protein
MLAPLPLPGPQSAPPVESLVIGHHSRFAEKLRFLEVSWSTAHRQKPR